MTTTRLTREQKAEELRSLLAESRNGANDFLHNPLFRGFIYTDGAKEVAELCGAYWLLDKLGAEVAPLLLRKVNEGELALAFLHMTVQGRKAFLRVSGHGDETLWSTDIGYTDFPEGEWQHLFEIGPGTWRGETCTAVTACLRSEH